MPDLIDFQGNFNFIRLVHNYCRFLMNTFAEKRYTNYTPMVSIKIEVKMSLSSHVQVRQEGSVEIMNLNCDYYLPLGLRTFPSHSRH